MITRNRFTPTKLALMIGLAGAMAATGALAQDTKKDDVVELETYQAEGQVEDTMGLMPTEPVKSVFGFGKTILETPRGVTSVSSDMMDSYAISGINDLVLVSPGAFTQSFFGVAGSLDVRGTPGEVYFRGVRRINNPGNYPTPIGASDRIDIVRGPASPIYGPSKIGGYLNFEPKSSRAETGQYLDKPSGKFSITRGSWDKNIVTAEVGGPASIGEKSLGYYVYAETENSGSYYDNSGTNQNVLQAAFNFDFSEKTRFEFGGMYHEYDGNQVAGWNRLTQDLIDHGTYITGSPTSVDTDGDGYNSAAEFDAWIATFNNGNFFAGGTYTNANGDVVPVDNAAMDPAWALQNVGTAKLKGNQTMVSPEDQLVTTVSTLFFDTIHEASDNFTITNKLFYEKLENINENAYGFSQFVDTYAVEDQLIFAFNTEHASWLKASYQVSPSIRYTNFKQGDDFDYEYFDRRDLTGPSTGLDRKLLATRTDSDYAGYRVGEFTDYGLAFLADYTIAEKVGVLLGARYDVLDLKSTMVGSKLHVQTADFVAKDTDESGSWTASISYNSDIGLTPYVTVSKQSTIVMGQGSEIPPDLIVDPTTGLAAGNAIADSDLKEVGIKGSLLDDRLYFALSAFEQTRTNYSAQDQVSNNTTESKGYELEARFLVTSNFTLTGAVTHLEITNLTAKDGGSQFGFVGAGDLPGVTDPSLFYGYVLKGISFVDSSESAKKVGIPENMYSLTGAYDFGNGLRATASVIKADSTYSGFSRGIKLPSYTLLNAGISYTTGDWTFGLQGKNLTDERYFRANFPDLFGGAIVLPELPRHFIGSASFKF